MFQHPIGSHQSEQPSYQVIQARIAIIYPNVMVKNLMFPHENDIDVKIPW
jgi:hypothetical protein